MSDTTINRPATPCKLRTGAWGARTAPEVQVGDTVTITTRAGKSWDARVTKIVWTGDDAAVVATESLDRPAPRKSRNGCSCDGDCCRPRCHCDAHCVCKGGNIYDC